MLQQCFGDDFKPTLFTKGREHFPKDFRLYVGEEVDEGLESGVELTEVRLVGIGVGVVIRRLQ
jgi:hypothetical protein